jgi:hypothetical protein
MDTYRKSAVIAIAKISLVNIPVSSQTSQAVDQKLQWIIFPECKQAVALATGQKEARVRAVAQEEIAKTLNYAFRAQLILSRIRILSQE